MSNLRKIEDFRAHVEIENKAFGIKTDKNEPLFDWSYYIWPVF